MNSRETPCHLSRWKLWQMFLNKYPATPNPQSCLLEFWHVPKQPTCFTSEFANSKLHKNPVHYGAGHLSVLKPCHLVRGGGCKVEIAPTIVRVCASWVTPLSKMRELCATSSKFLSKVPSNFHVVCLQHVSTSSLRQFFENN